MYASIKLIILSYSKPFYSSIKHRNCVAFLDGDIGSVLDSNDILRREDKLYARARLVGARAGESHTRRRMLGGKVEGFRSQIFDPKFGSWKKRIF